MSDVLINQSPALRQVYDQAYDSCMKQNTHKTWIGGGVGYSLGLGLTTAAIALSGPVGAGAVLAYAFSGVGGGVLGAAAGRSIAKHQCSDEAMSALINRIGRE